MGLICENYVFQLDFFSQHAFHAFVIMKVLFDLDLWKILGNCWLEKFKPQIFSENILGRRIFYITQCCHFANWHASPLSRTASAMTKMLSFERVCLGRPERPRCWSSITADLFHFFIILPIAPGLIVAPKRFLKSNMHFLYEETLNMDFEFEFGFNHKLFLWNVPSWMQRYNTSQVGSHFYQMLRLPNT